MLIVLDNCEHLVDECAELSEDLLLRTRSPTVLATSREALRVEGESVWPVAPLDVEGGDDAAVELFMERARAVRPDFAADGAADAAVAEICVRLDGLPLAIELAAARVAHMPPTEIAARLHDRFALLTAGPRRSRR
ncbi:MAG: hypothetical protein M3253_02025, partial [Chloroflexota bacterium]|nr:hypothetical protein [Chloroflexota bacterium]